MVIKVVRSVTGLNLKDAKSALRVFLRQSKSGIQRGTEELKKKFEEAGATVELK